jgi:hypothetical protein
MSRSSARRGLSRDKERERERATTIAFTNDVCRVTHTAAGSVIQSQTIAAQLSLSCLTCLNRLFNFGRNSLCSSDHQTPNTRKKGDPHFRRIISQPASSQSDRIRFVRSFNQTRRCADSLPVRLGAETCVEPASNRANFAANRFSSSGSTRSTCLHWSDVSALFQSALVPLLRLFSFASVFRST